MCCASALCLLRNAASFITPFQLFHAIVADLLNHAGVSLLIFRILFSFYVLLFTAVALSRLALQAVFCAFAPYPCLIRAIALIESSYNYRNLGKNSSWASEFKATFIILETSKIVIIIIIAIQSYLFFLNNINFIINYYIY